MVGGLEEFLPYINDYVKTFMGKSITTEQWKDHLFAFFKQHGTPEQVSALERVKWDVGISFSGPCSLNSPLIGKRTRPGCTARVRLCRWR